MCETPKRGEDVLGYFGLHLKYYISNANENILK